MNYEDIKRHFESSPPPKEAKWTEWAYISDTQLFLKSCYIGIRNFNGPADRCPAWWHLKEFYILMKKAASQTAGEESPIEEASGEIIAEAASEKAVSEEETAV
ncbi:DUF6965 family protein [Flavobacterium tistrianum]|uniref:DUF6965 family protein n=1 Tax=Flavobacterium tistrianum TaxID=1685414 RepID=UPI000DAE7B3C|nr:hypothetical protein [Flavobacterium tistrianum]KAF2340394.1 hypothetical protein DMB71_14795 [Flavobacterium tistrianum]